MFSCFPLICESFVFLVCLLDQKMYLFFLVFFYRFPSDHPIILVIAARRWEKYITDTWNIKTQNCFSIAQMLSNSLIMGKINNADYKKQKLQKKEKKRKEKFNTNSVYCQFPLGKQAWSEKLRWASDGLLDSISLSGVETGSRDLRVTSFSLTPV